ncbi:Protein EXORDIUM-like 2 [Carex littledalei]|uniref:Protein EXORDIUM-like 2 n=1 Tax=Carex littledalei TaxID=544730 RepID=A0A833VW20_9POAL|nr:Protein EXORDIUM-like 2 [Carex littledalei]
MGINLLHLFPLLLLPLLATAEIPQELFLVPPEPLILDYHNGPLLTGNYSVNIIWYGNFTAAQRAIVADFITSLSASTPAPSVASWWKTISLYKGGGVRITLGSQYFDTKLSFGKSLTRTNLSQLATNSGTHRNSITAIFTAPDVLVEVRSAREIIRDRV